MSGIEDKIDTVYVFGAGASALTHPTVNEWTYYSMLAENFKIYVA